MMPAGREPLSRSSPHSYPRVSVPRVAEPEVRAATLVLRQKRSADIDAGTLIVEVPEFTVQIWPIRAFSGRPPSATGEPNRRSRQVPVVTFGIGSSLTPPSVSL